MFVGTVPSPVLKFLDIDFGKYSVGCVGAFTIPLSVRGQLHWANDISLLSFVISAHLNGEILSDLEITVPEIYEKAKKYLNNEKQLAAVWVIFEMMDFWEKGHIYAKRRVEYFLKYFDELVEKWWNKNQKFGMLKHFYYNGDVFDFINIVPKDEIILMFPPTYKLGYEKMFEKLHKVFNYTLPEHTIIDDEKYIELWELVKRRGNYVYYTDRPLDGRLVFYYEFVANKHPIHIYSDVLDEIAGTYEVANYDFLPYPPLRYDYDFTEDTKITIRKISIRENMYLHSKYFKWFEKNPNVSRVPYVFLADGQVFGLASFFRTLSSDRTVFMIEDLVLPSKYKRLSKLLIMLVKTKEMRKKLEDELGEELTTIRTFVITQRPSSMKYRGVFKLVERAKGGLRYTADFQDVSIEEVYLEWLRKYGEIIR